MNSQYGKKLSDYPKVDDFSQADRESFIGSALIHAIGKKDGATNYSDGNLTLGDLKSEQIQSDWNEADSANPAYIKNKPTIPDVSDMATKTWVGEQGYLTSIPSDYITETELAEALSSKMNSTESSAFYPMATNPSGYLTQHQSLDGYATEEFVYSQTSGKMGKITAGTDLVIDGSVIKINTNGTATGDFSFVEGDSTSAIGDFGAHSEGYKTIAYGEASHAEGDRTSAFGDNGTHAEGYKTIASGYTSHAEGDSTSAFGGYGTHAEGYCSLAYGDTSHAEGEETSAVGNSSHTEGFKAFSTGEFGAHAEGNNTSAVGSYGSHAEGFKSIAQGDTSHAEGEETSAFGEYASHSEGYYTLAYGDTSHAEGDRTSAFGEGSHTEGLGTIAEDKSMHAGGQFNSTTSGVLFVIGNGYYDEEENLVRSDAFMVDMDGYASATILGTSGIGDLEAYIRYLEGRIYALEQEAGVTVPTVNGFSPTVNGIVPTV